MKRHVAPLMLLLLMAVPALAQQVPRTLSYQGVLTDNSGVPLADGSHSLHVRIYETASGGAHLWEEIVNVDSANGVFHAILGKSAALTLSFDEAYWMGLTVDAGVEMTPRIELTSTPYSLNAATVEDGAINAAKIPDGTVVRSINGLTDNIAIAGINGVTVVTDPVGGFLMIDGASGGGGSDADWLITGSNMGSIPTGNIGLGTTTPTEDFHFFDDQNSASILKLENGANPGVNQVYFRTATPNHTFDFQLVELGSVGGMLMQSITPNMGILVEATAELTLKAQDEMLLSAGGTTRVYLDPAGPVEIRDNAGEATVLLDPTVSSGGQMRLTTPSGQVRAYMGAQEPGLDRGGFLALYDDSGQLQIKLDADFGNTNSSRIIADVLQLKGGADLSENFQVLGEQIEAGMVVSIDPDRPGGLMLSGRAYDTRVAGVISGAGGVHAGLLMGQEGSIADGDHPVALTGRVYCYADATEAPIRPGDLLTTSTTPGHAMRAGDTSRSHGAILGKAMTSLESGRGMVLALVTLQ